MSLCIDHLIIIEQTHYLITMDVLPAKESYEIGSTVTINCTVYPTPVFHEDTPLPIFYIWSSTYGAISSRLTIANTLTITVPNYHLHSVNYYCWPFSNGRLLGTQKITLNVKGTVLAVNLIIYTEATITVLTTL